MLINSATNNGDDSAEDGIRFRLSRINEINFAVAELIKSTIKRNDILVQLELPNDVVTCRKNKGV